MPASLTVALALAGAAATAAAEIPAELGPVSGKVVLVDFWASWCAPCRRSFPWMNSMHRKYGEDGLEIIAVNVDKERALADGFLAETPAEFAVRFDPAGALAETFDVKAMPSSFLLDGSGEVIAAHYGFRTADAEEYERRIRAALAQSGSEDDEPKEGTR
ncbi:MAG: TlpA family protein disulfide reductase [Gammaproteobacteria bacterium]|nr:TlpA family protein disulfide reductase [Gammaproteobacteria bacterium]